MRKLIYFVFPVIITAACNNKGITESLNEIESLTDREQYDSASVALSKINERALSHEAEKAHYYLLRKQLGYLTQKPDTTNMLDSLVIPYYKETNNQEKLAEALYYKGYKEICNGHIPEAITYYKHSEELAANTSNPRLQYKIAESLSYANGVSGNYAFQLDYAHKSAKLATLINNKGWMAYSYISISSAHSSLGHNDSSLFYINKAAQLREFIPNTEKYGFLINLAFYNKESRPEIAKKYLLESISIKETSYAYEHLADIFYEEGHQEESYRLWKKALSINDDNPKDLILHNLLDYDLEQNRTDSVCQYVNEIITIKDSVIDNLRNDTIKDLQLRFDHEVAMHKQEKITNNWQKGLLVAILFISLLITYIIIKRYREKTRMQEAQMQINDLMNQIRELEESEEDNSAAIQKLNDQIKNIMDKEGALLKHGKILYDKIKNGEKVHGWRKKEFELFINYFKAIDYKTVNRLERTKRKEKLTPQKLFFLLLKEMGYEKKEIARILSIEETSVNTLNTRTRPVE